MSITDDVNGKIYVGIPRERIMFNQFVDNRDMILSRMQEQNRLAGSFIAEGHRVDRNRDRIVEEFLGKEDKPPWLLMLDSDMEHPINAPERLVSYCKPIVGALYFHRGDQHEPFAFKYSGMHKDKWGREIPLWASMRDEVYDYLIRNGVPMRDGAFTIDDSLGEYLIDCDAVATGCILIHRSVFEKMKPPWFEYVSGGTSEDLVFCKKAKELGIPVIADLSTVCGHFNWVAMGQAQFRMNYEGRGVNLSSYSKRDAIDWVSKFLKVKPEKAEKMITASNGHMVGELWNKMKPSGTAAVNSFYKRKDVGKLYLFELLTWNYTPVFANIRLLLTGIRKLNVIEIGSGIGSIAIQLIVQNNNVLAAEVNRFLRDFTDFRWKELKEGISAANGQLSIVGEEWKSKSPDESFDVAISIDTFEHLPEDELKSVLVNLHRVLKMGGKLVYHANWGQEDLYPMHFNYSEWFKPFCLELGFLEVHEMEMMKVR